MLKNSLLENYVKFIEEFSPFEPASKLVELLPSRYEKAFKENNVALFKKLMSSNDFYHSTERMVVHTKQIKKKNERE